MSELPPTPKKHTRHNVTNANVASLKMMQRGESKREKRGEKRRKKREREKERKRERERALGK